MKQRMVPILIALVSMAACGPAITSSSAPGAISGRVIDAITGKPIARANVNTDPPTSSVTTDLDGSYTIENIPPGDCTVTATSGGKLSASVSVRVEVGKTTPADVHISPVTRAATSVPFSYRLAKAGASSNTDWAFQIEAINGVLMALVPTGCFVMGSTSEQAKAASALCDEEWGSPQCYHDWFANEQPAHQVCFEVPFWIDVYEVTQAQFREFAGEAMMPSHFTGDDRPRETISWDEADAFCRKRGARLPTEAEWEFAARGPDASAYPWGNSFVADNVVYDGNSEGHSWDVGSRPGGRSWVGALDMSGNVWEWVADWYQPDYYRSLTDGVPNPLGPEDGEQHVLRGGSWYGYGTNFLRTALRLWDDPADRLDHYGFRCAVSD